MLRALLVAFVVTTTFTAVLAADVPLAGDRARVSDLRAQRRAQLISYSSAIDLMAVDPTVSGATLDIYSPVTGEQITLSLPAGAWQGPLPGRRFRYTQTADHRIRILLVSGRLLRVTLQGTASFPLGEPQGSIAARLTIGATRFCLSFGGTIAKDDGKRFVARGAPAPAACVPVPNDGPCVGQPDGTPCDDGKACTGASRCLAGACSIAESPNCRSAAGLDRSYCDLATGSCVPTPACPPYLNGDKCRPLVTLSQTNPEVGCAYGQVLCSSDGCGAMCNSTTGACEQNASCTCFQPQPPDAGCFHGTCRTEYCLANLNDAPNCNGQDFVNCEALNTNTCAVPIPDNPSPETFQGCQEGIGCVYTFVNCAQGQPFGPLDDPCTEYVNEPTVPGCCTIAPKDCAGRFGNAPGFTYGCQDVGGVGVCRAAPQ